MSEIKDDVYEVIEVLYEIPEFRQILENLVEEEEEEYTVEIEEEEEYTVVEENTVKLVEIQKFNFGFNVLNSILLVCIIFSIWLSKLEV